MSEPVQHPTETELFDLADGTLEPPARAAAEHHLATCAACAAEVARMRRTLDGLAALPRAAEPAADLWPALLARLEAERAEADGVIPLRPRRSPVEGAAPWLRRAAVAVLLLGAGAVAGRMSAREPQVASLAPVPVNAAEDPVLRFAADGASTPLEAAADIQRTGTAFVMALGAFHDLGARAGDDARAQAYEAAMGAMYGAAREITRLAPEASTGSAEVYRAVSTVRQSTAPAGDRPLGPRF